VRVVLQRVAAAEVRVGGEVVGRTGRGFYALVGVGHRSTSEDARWLAGKTEGLRVFPDEQGRMNRSVAEIGGEVLAISQFTLYADTRKGRRPSFVDAAPPELADPLYEAYCQALTVPVARGVFGAHMDIRADCDGPVTVLLERESGA
jgi:D-tyrosyl-tRNA(Tyr) deacylase